MLGAEPVEIRALRDLPLVIEPDVLVFSSHYELIAAHGVAVNTVQSHLVGALLHKQQPSKQRNVQ
jgi:hypothetical protein